MAGSLDGVDMYNQAAGRDRLELLLFRLAADERFGIDVFKVREVIQCPQLTPVPQSHPAVLGSADTRGNTISVMDLSQLIGGPPIEGPRSKLVIVTEYRGELQGFLVDSADHIASLDRNETLPPPADAERDTFISAVAQVDREAVRILDIEKLLQEL